MLHEFLAGTLEASQCTPVWAKLETLLVWVDGKE